VVFGQLRRHVVDASPVVGRGRLEAGVKHDRATGQGGSCDNAGHVQRSSLHVALDLTEVDSFAQRRAQGFGVQQRLQTSTGDAEHFTRVLAEPQQRSTGDQVPRDLTPPDRLPDHQRLGYYFADGQVRVGGEEARVHGPHARADHDPRPFSSLLERRQQNRQHADLVRATRAATRQDEGDRHRIRSLAHPPILCARNATRGAGDRDEIAR